MAGRQQRRLDDPSRPRLSKEFAKGVDASLYAGTYPLEALSMLIGEAASKKDAELHI